jgi:hypothetical protein
MKSTLPAILLFIILSMTSCFEIIEDVTVHQNGSGTYSFIVNLSQSKNQIDKIRTQDSILNFKVPTLAMAETKITEVKNKLTTVNGISNVLIKQDHTNYIYHLSCDFKNVAALNAAMLRIWKTYDKKAPDNFQLYRFENGVFTRNTNTNELDHITHITNSQIREMMQKSTYTLICRFDEPVTNSNNMNYTLSPSKKATLYKKDVWTTLADNGISNNSISIVK